MISPLLYLMMTVSPAKKFFTELSRYCEASLLHGLTMILPDLPPFKRKLPLLLVR